MSRLIDADALLNNVKRAVRTDDLATTIAVGICKEHINEMPTIDAVPVVHGHWISYPECLAYDEAYLDIHIVCSNCKDVWNIIDNEADYFDYCPHCGAKMDEVTP